jgi:hypothetical protein
MAGGASSPEISIESENLQRIEELDILSKLRHGYMVTNTEKETLLALAAGIEDEANAVDAEISRLMGSRDKLRRAAGQAKSLVAPIRRLPPDILVEIFVLTYSTTYFECNSQLAERAGDCGVPMMLAGKVCSSWRQLVLTTPSLWSHITIHDFNHESLALPAVPSLERALALSGNVLLHLELKCMANSSAVTTLIRQYSHRWKHIEIDGNHNLFVEVFNPPSLPDFSFPALSSLCLSSKNFLALQWSPSTRVKIQSAKNLRTLFLDAILHSPVQPLPIDLPWEQLEELTFSEINLPAFFIALPQCASIRKVTLLAVSKPPGMQTPSHDRLSSTTLTELQFELFTNDGCIAMEDCFEKLTFPTLKKLHVQADISDEYDWGYPDLAPEWPVASFKAFVERSGFTLTTLCLLQFPMGDRTLISVLECLPELEELVIRQSMVEFLFAPDCEVDEDELHSLTNYLMDRLHVRPPDFSNSESSPNDVQAESVESEDCKSMIVDSTLVPYLKHLKLEGKGSPEIFSFERFFDMVKSRCRAPEGSMSNLKSVELRISAQKVSEAIQEEIAGLSSDGLVLDVVGAFVE